MDCRQPTFFSRRRRHGALLLLLLLFFSAWGGAQAASSSRFGDAEPLYERGAHLLRQGEVAEAVSVLARASELAPEEPDIYKCCYGRTFRFPNIII